MEGVERRCFFWGGVSDLKSDNFVVIATALIVTSKLIGADLISATESYHT
jgi:hypothetical protein